MSYDKEKLSRFENTVLSETQEKIDSIIKEAEEYKQSELEKAKQQEYDKMFNYMQSQVRNIQWKYKQVVTKASLDAKRKTLVFRNELSQKVFEETEKSLKDFADSAKYKDYIVQKFQSAIKNFECDGAILLLRKEDMPLAEELKKIAGIQNVETDKTNLLGGFKIENRKTSLLLDESFASILADQKQYFYQNSGLTLAE